MHSAVARLLYGDAWRQAATGIDAEAAADTKLMPSGALRSHEAAPQQQVSAVGSPTRQRGRRESSEPSTPELYPDGDRGLHTPDLSHVGGLWDSFSAPSLDFSKASPISTYFPSRHVHLARTRSDASEPRGPRIRLQCGLPLRLLLCALALLVLLWALRAHMGAWMSSDRWFDALSH